MVAVSLRRIKKATDWEANHAATIERMAALAVVEEAAQAFVDARVVLVAELHVSKQASKQASTE